MRTVQKSHRAVPCSLAEGFADFRRPIELGKVFTPELLPFPGIVTEPLAYVVTRGDVYEPFGELQLVFIDSARPKPLDQVACSVRGTPLVEDSFQFNHLVPSFPPNIPSIRKTTSINSSH